jgi:hypothetical protein
MVKPTRSTTGDRRKRPARRFLRFGVSAPASDKVLIRTIAERLRETGAAADDLRSALREAIWPKIADEPGSIWRALRASPLVNADLDLERENPADREVDL